MSVFFVKPIKPPGLKVSAVRLEILNALRKEGRLERKMLQATTQHWTGAKPTMEFLIGLTGNDASLLVGPSGSGKGAQKWVWINDGTPPHIIRPRNASRLRFRPNSTSGSSPNTLSVGRGGSSGNFVFAKEVHHPGIKARNWNIVVLKERQNPFFRLLNEALARGMQKAGG